MHRKLFFFIFLVSAICLSVAALDSGLFIETPFPGVKVYIDGNYRGDTSEGIAGRYYLRVELAPGKYRVRTEYRDDERIYDPVESTVEVPSDKFNVYKVTFQSTRIRSESANETSNVQTTAAGIIKVRSTPPGAYITVNGVRIRDNLTDADLYDVPVGNKTVKVSFASLDPLSISFFLSEDEEVVVNADFEKQKITVDKEYDINISTNPKDAAVRIDGKDYGRTPLRVRLLHGTHEISISRKGFATISKNITVTRNDSLKFDLGLKNITLHVSPDKTANESVKVLRKDGRGMFHNVELDAGKGLIPYNTAELIFINSKTNEALRLPFDPDQINKEIMVTPRFPVIRKDDFSIEDIPGYKSPPPEPDYKKTYRYESRNAVGKKLLGALGIGALGTLGGLLFDAALGTGTEFTIGGAVLGGIIGFASTNPDRERVRIPENVSYNAKLREEWQDKNRRVQAANEKVYEEFLENINDSRPSLTVIYDEHKKIQVPRPSEGWGDYRSPVKSIEATVTDRTNLKFTDTDVSAFITFFVKMKNDFVFDPDKIEKIQVESPADDLWTIKGNQLEKDWNAKEKTFKLFNMYSTDSPHTIITGIWKLSITDTGKTTSFYQTILPYGETGAARKTLYSAEGKGDGYPISQTVRNASCRLNGEKAEVKFTVTQSENSKAMVYFYGEDGSDYKYLGNYGYLDLSKENSSIKKFDIPLNKAHVTSQERKILSHVLIMLEREHPSSKTSYVYYSRWIPIR
jgi:hypothetical protein